MNKKTVWEYIRIKFKPGTDPKGKRTKFSRPIKIYKITITHEDGSETFEFAPSGVVGTSRRIDPGTFITEWERAGHTPTQRPLRKYCDESLKKLGYSIEEIKGIRGRNFSAKDVNLVFRNLKISKEEAKTLLTEHKGNRHEIYRKKMTVGRKIDGDWKTTNTNGKPWKCPETGGSKFFNKKKNRRTLMQTSNRSKKR